MRHFLALILCVVLIEHEAQAGWSIGIDMLRDWWSAHQTVQPQPVQPQPVPVRGEVWKGWSLGIDPKR